jgi:hypothetical protein
LGEIFDGQSGLKFGYPRPHNYLTLPAEAVFTMSSAFGALMTIESGDLPIRPPQKPKSFDQDASRERPVPLEFGDVEMLPIPISDHSSGSRDRIENVDEAQRISSDMDRDNQRQGPISDQIQTIWYPYKNRFRVMAACLTSMANGMNDSAPGALIASLERYEEAPEP